MKQGRVVRPAVLRHACSPGWEWKRADHEIVPGSGSYHYGVLPDPLRYPEGTVWECECGRRWVSLGRIHPNMPGRCFWRPERITARLWRLAWRSRP